MRPAFGMGLMLMLGALAVAQTPPPGSIVIRPNGPTTTTPLYPDKPGFIVIRPGGLGARTPPAAETPTKPGDTMPRLVGIGPDKKPASDKLKVPEPGSGKPEPADPMLGKVLFEAWDVAFLRGLRIGYYHTLVREHRHDGRDYIYATKTQKLTLARFGQRAEQWAEDATLEDRDGNVLLTRMRQGIGKDQKLSLMGQVRGDILSVTIEGTARGQRDVPFPPGVLGIAKEASFFKDKKPKKGDKLEYIIYEGRVNQTVKMRAEFVGEETTQLAEGHKKRTFLIAEQSMEPIQGFQLPPAKVWVDAETLEPMKLESDIPALGGKLVLMRTTKEFCLRPLGVVPELNEVQSIRVAQDIPNVHSKQSVTYRVTLANDLPPEKFAKAEARQKFSNIDKAARTFDLEVTPLKVQGPGTEQAGPEYLADCFYIDWNNDATKRLAEQAVRNLPLSASNLDKAKAIERWVNQNMKAAEFSQAMATCSNVAKSLSGDCTEYAMLAAGMCRALGIPSRTALGLVFAHGRDRSPILAYHMWFEAFHDGHWFPLDATLGLGGVGCGHIKIVDLHWQKEESFAPILPVMNVLASQPKVRVLEVK